MEFLDFGNGFVDDDFDDMNELYSVTFFFVQHW